MTEGYLFLEPDGEEETADDGFRRWRPLVNTDQDQTKTTTPLVIGGLLTDEQQRTATTMQDVLPRLLQKL